MRSTLFFLVVALLTLGTCRSGKKALQQGDYEEAVLTAINRLKQNPNNKKARQVLDNAYEALLDYNLDRIRNLSSTTDPYRWEETAGLYGQLNDIYHEIKRTPAASDIIRSPRLFLEEAEAAAGRAAAARYDLGREALSPARAGNREAAKEAFGHFTTADAFQPGYRDAAALAREARALAVVRVRIEPIPMPTRTLDISNEFFYNKIVEFVRGNTLSPFVEFYTAREAESTGLEADQRVLLAFDDFVIGQAYIRETVEKRSRDSVVVGQVEVIEEGKKVTKDVYGSVTADVHYFQKEINSRGVLDCRIVSDRSGGVLTQQKFPGSFSWIDYWGYYNGDERALTREDRDHVRNRREVMPPPPQDLFIAFTQPIFRDVTGYLRQFYEGY